MLNGVINYLYGVGFEPTRPKPADLKSAPLDLSGIQADRLSWGETVLYQLS